MHSSRRGLLAAGQRVALVAVLAAGLALAAAPPAGVNAAEVTVTLPAGGGWAAYRFDYPGDGRNVGVTLSYDPAAGVPEEALVLEAYGPEAPPPGGTPIGAATLTATPGQKYWQLGSDTAGPYVLLVQNWDALGRAATVTITTTDVTTGTAGPEIGLVAQAAPPATAAQPTLPPAGPAAGPASAAVSFRVPAGGWAAYRFSYPGDGRDVGVTLRVSPADGVTEQAVKLEAYGPEAPPPGGTPIGAATPTGTAGEQYWQLGSTTAGTYVLVVHNWDPLGREVSVEIKTTDVATGAAGPALALVSTGS